MVTSYSFTLFVCWENTVGFLQFWAKKKKKKEIKKKLPATKNNTD